MLREARNAWFGERRTLLGRRYFLVQGEIAGEPRWRRRELAALSRAQHEHPVRIGVIGTRTFWAFEGRLYWEDDALGQDDVLALVRDHERRRRQKLERAHAALRGDRSPSTRRTAIPRQVRQLVWRRDGARCVRCASDFELQFDHVIPLALGGASSPENLQVLCADCNRSKGTAVG